MKHRSILHRFVTAAIAPAALLLGLALLTAPVLAAPETPVVRPGHGSFTFDYYREPGVTAVEPGAEYGLTDQLAVKGLWHETSFDDPQRQNDHQVSLGLKYEVSPNLAVEGFTERGWDEVDSGTAYGFGLLAGKHFGPLYASLRWQEIGIPVYGERLWYSQVTAVGSYPLTPQLNLLGGVTATLSYGTAWEASYGLEWQANRQLALHVNRFPDRDQTQVGAEYRF